MSWFAASVWLLHRPRRGWCQHQTSSLSETGVARCLEFLDLGRGIDGLARGAAVRVHIGQHGLNHGIDRRRKVGRRIVRAGDQRRWVRFTQSGYHLEHVALKQGFIGFSMMLIMR